jgi:hypothetical protein
MFKYKPNEISPKTQFWLVVILCVTSPVSLVLMFLSKGNVDLQEVSSSAIGITAGVYMTRKGSKLLREQRESRDEEKSDDAPNVGPLGL